MFAGGIRSNRTTSRYQGLRSLWREDAGQDLIEYALIVGLMCAAALSPVAQALSNGVDTAQKKFKEHTDNGLHKEWDKNSKR